MNEELIAKVKALPGCALPADPHIPPQMLWHDAAVAQFNLFRGFGIALDADVDSVGTHRSKSIDLPVVRFVFRSGSVAIVRDNFYDYKITAIASQPGCCVAGDLAKRTDHIRACYCEGFPGWMVLGAPAFNVSAFTAEVRVVGLFAILHGLCVSNG